MKMIILEKKHANYLKFGTELIDIDLHQMVDKSRKCYFSPIMLKTDRSPFNIFTACAVY
jgi:hypothetical protein